MQTLEKSEELEELEPLKLTIPGNYYDSQIYDNRLYLWKTDGSISVLNWEKLIDSIGIDEKLKIVAGLGFQYGDELYGNLLLKDAEIREITIKKFKTLSKITINLSNDNLKKAFINLKDNPFPFPHADSYIHYKSIYVGSQSGVSRCYCSHIISDDCKPEKLWDAPIFSLTASHETLALAAGSEGLFDYSLNDQYSQNYKEPRHITNNHSNFARWLYPGIFSSSYFNGGYFADFQEIKDTESKNEDNKNDKKTKQPASRKFKEIFTSQKIFSNKVTNKSSRFTWGARDKICLVTEDSIELVECFPRAGDYSRKFKKLGSKTVDDFTGDIISADSSFFGVVLEEDDGLLIINSLLQHKRLPGEPVNWRVFPNSKNYTNQLHVIYEDSIHIYSFTHDYFVNQKKKIMGMSLKTK